MSSIQRTLTMSIIASVGLLLAIAAVIAESHFRQNAQTLFDDGLIERAKSLITLTEYEPLQREIEFEFADEVMPEFDQATRNMYYQLLFMDSTILEKSRSLGNNSLPVLDVNRSNFGFLNVVLPDGRPGRMVETVFSPRLEMEADMVPVPGSQASSPQRPLQQPLQKNAPPKHALPESTVEIPLIRLAIARGRGQLDAQISFFRRLIVAYVMLTGLILLVLVPFIVRRGLLPLKSLAEDVGRMDETNLGGDIRFKDPRERAELVPIQRQLAALASRLNQAFEREKRFSSDVAHELYTPISELKLLAEVGQLSAHDTQSIKTLLLDAENISDQMHRIVRDLLVLTETENGTADNFFERFDLAKLVEEMAVSVQNSDPEFAAVRYRNNVDSDLVISNDVGKLKMIIRNFLSNAFSYASGDKLVSVSVRENKDDSTLSVVIENQVSDLDRADLVSMSDRFWRKDPSRTGTKHSGLGLSIADAMADYLDLKIELGLTEERVFSAVVHGLKKHSAG